MALSSGLLRRASPSHRLFGFWLLQFSTNSPCVRSPAVSFGKRIENDVASDTRDLVPLPNGFPFTFKACIAEPGIYMRRQLQKEDITVCVPYKDYRPSQLSMVVNIRKPSAGIYSDITVMQDRLRINQVRVVKFDDEMDHFKGYLKSRVITPNTMSFLFDRLYPGHRKS